MQAVLRVFVFMFSFLYLFFSASQAQSIKSDLKSLSEKSDIILEGKVVNKKSDWNKDKSRIFTAVTVQVDDYLKGNNSNKTIVINTPGGEVDGIGELYTHMPSFKEDEEVLLFVQEDKRNSNYKVFNGEDGKFTIVKDKKTGEKVTSFNQKVSSIKSEIKNYIQKKSQQ